MSDIKPHFRNAINFREFEFAPTNPGETTEPMYAEKIDPETLEGCLVEVGRRDLVELHQRDISDTDLNILAERFQLGDVSALSRIADVFYGDNTELPRNGLEAANQVLFARQSFDLLPIDVKEKFDNNYLKWLGSINALDTETLVQSGLAKYVKEPSSEPAPKGEMKNDE